MLAQAEPEEEEEDIVRAERLSGQIEWDTHTHRHIGKIKTIVTD